MNFYFFPPKEAVKLHVLFAPATDLDHDIGGLYSVLLVLVQLAEDRFFRSIGRIDGEEFDEEGFCLPGFLVISGEGVPPPVISFSCLFAYELELVSSDIVLVEHTFEL